MEEEAVNAVKKEGSMKLNVLAEFKINSIEAFAWGGMVFGTSVFLVATFWDNIAGVQINHNSGYGWQQITVMAISGLFTFWGWTIQDAWGER